MDNEQAIFDYRTWKQETAGLPMDDVPDDVVLEMSKMDQTYTTQHDVRPLKRDETLILGGPGGGRIVQVSNPPNPFIQIPEPDVAPIAQWSSSSQSYRGNVRMAVYRFIPFESRHAFTGLYVSSDLLPSDLTRGINHSEEQGR